MNSTLHPAITMHPHRPQCTGIAALGISLSNGRTLARRQARIGIKSKTLAVTFMPVTAFAVICIQEQASTQPSDNNKANAKKAAQDMKDLVCEQPARFAEGFSRHASGSTE